MEEEAYQNIQEIVSSDNESEDKEEKENAFNPLVSSRKFTITGLRNLGNSCYLNAVVKNLKNLQRFLQETSKSEGATTEGNVSAELTELVGKMQTEQYKIMSPRLLIYTVMNKGPQFTKGKQQDAHKFLTWLLQKIDEEKGVSVQERNYGIFEGT